MLLPALAKLFVTVALFLLHSAAVGFAALGLLGTWPTDDATAHNPHLRWFFAISIGLVVNVAALFVLGLTGSLNRPAVLCVGLALLVLAAALQFRNRSSVGQARARAFHVDAILLGLLLVVTLLSAMHPPGLWDDTSYHLPLAHSYVNHGGIFLNEYLRYPLFPQNMHLLVALGLMLGGDLTAQAFATLPMFVIAIGLLGASEWIAGSIAPGALAAVILLMLQPVRITFGYAFVDDGLALFCWGATLALALWSQSEGPSARTWLLVASVLAGAAAGTKPFGGVFALLAGAYLLLMRRDWKSASIYGLGMMAFGSWWYARSFMISGDPVHPAGGNLFGHFLWNADDLVRQRKEQTTYGMPAGSLNLVGAFAKMGVLAWLPAFAIPLFRKPRAAIDCFLFLFLTYLVFWFFFAQVDRYLAPVYVVATFLAALAAYRLYDATPLRRLVDRRSERARTALSMLLVASILVPLAYGKLQRAEHAMASRQATLARFPGYDLFAKANELIPQFGDRLVEVGFENAIYFFDGTAIGDWFGPGRYRDMTDCQEGRCGPIAPEAMKRVLQKFGAKMLAVSTARFPKLDRSAYGEQFDVVMENDVGLLMVAK